MSSSFYSSQVVGAPSFASHDVAFGRLDANGRKGWVDKTPARLLSLIRVKDLRHAQRTAQMNNGADLGVPSVATGASVRDGTSRGKQSLFTLPALSRADCTRLADSIGGMVCAHRRGILRRRGFLVDGVLSAAAGSSSPGSGGLPFPERPRILKVSARLARPARPRRYFSVPSAKLLLFMATPRLLILDLF